MYSMNAIKKLRDLCQARGIRLLVAIFRGPWQRPEWTSQYEYAVSSGLSALDVNHFVLRWAADRLTQSEFEVSWNDKHPSALARRIMAEEILTEFQK